MTAVSWWAIAAGGAMGALARAAIGAWIAGVDGLRWPMAALTVNIVGCLFAGLLTGWLLSRGESPWPWLRPLLLVGFLGAFTTFSAFSLETVQLQQQAGWGAASAHIAMNLFGSVLACALGLWLAGAGRTAG